MALFVVAALAVVVSNASAQWRSVPYNAGNFTASGSMTWTVDSADQVNFRYVVDDRTMTVSAFINNSSVAGTAAPILQIKIPGGYKAGSTMGNVGHLFRESGVPSHETVVIITDTNSDLIKIYRPGFGNHQLSTNQTHVYFTITFDVCADEPDNCS